MAKTEMIRARMEPVLKKDAEEILGKLGLSATEAITLFYKQVTLRHGLPFPVQLPNAETKSAMEETEAGENLTEWPDLDALKAKHG